MQFYTGFYNKSRFVSFAIIYRKRCDKANGVQDVLPGSYFVSALPYTLKRQK